MISDSKTIERRSFEAKHAGDIWQGDVMHGPTIFTPQGKRKVYLVSLMDDASRLIVHRTQGQVSILHFRTRTKPFLTSQSSEQ